MWQVSFKKLDPATRQDHIAEALQKPAVGRLSAAKFVQSEELVGGVKIFVSVAETEHDRVGSEGLQKCCHHWNRTADPGPVGGLAIEIFKHARSDGRCVVARWYKERVGASGGLRNLCGDPIGERRLHMGTNKLKHKFG